MIYESDNKEKYTRNIEMMGKYLVLLEVTNIMRRVGMNYHLFFTNDRKPPLDIAINSEKNTIEYISYFIQDEKIVNKPFLNQIEFCNKRIKIVDADWNDKNYETTIKKNFNIFMENDCIGILDCRISGVKSITGYEINSKNYILFDPDKKFVGIVMAKICTEEWDKFRKAKVI